MAHVSHQARSTMDTRPLELSWKVPRPGENIAGKYVVEGLCGRGGLSAVLSAVQVGLDRRVALKILLPEWADEPEVIERFLREGRAATRIRSEHVVRVFDVDRLPCGAPYLVLEYLEGHNLDDVVAMWGPLPVATAVDWVLQAAEALAEAHAHGIVHRDLKPGNLFLTRRFDGGACVKVIDFGLSKLSDPGRYAAHRELTRPTDVMGTPQYMAPEQLRASRDVDARTDIWALGAVLHELLTGQPAFRGETVPEVCATVLTQQPARVSSLRANVPAALEAVVLRCLEKDPGARFGSVLEMARAIAPLGTEAGATSCERIERMEMRVSGPSPLPPLDLSAAGGEGGEGDSWPSDLDLVRKRFGTPASGKVVFAGLSMLLLVGGGAFAWLYVDVHGPARAAVAELQGSGAPASATVPPPAPEPARAPSATASASTAPPPRVVHKPPVTRPRPSPPIPAATHLPSARPDDVPWLRSRTEPSPDVPAPPPPPTADDPFAGRK